MPETLAQRLRQRAALAPDRRAYVFLADGEEEQGSLTWGELDARARGIAASLQERSSPGDRALLLCPPGLDFVASFFGCLYAGVVAVPAYPPRSARALPRLRTLLEDSGPAVALAPAAAAARIRSWLARHPELPPLPWLATDEVPPERAGAWREPLLGGEDLAFLQYTSGSTATPKGVMVSRANLDHNQEVIRQACGHTADSVFVTWLPLYHDLGLIGNLLQAAWVGAQCVLMAPVAFLQSPARWLRAVWRYRATTSGGPNFAYDLCVRKVPAADREGLDLSSWQVAFNGAEPVRTETLERFAAAFAPAGFRREALYPCYGLAEATLMVAGNRPGEGPVVRGRSVGCGRALADLDVVIADPATSMLCPAGQVGEIWVAGGSVARGYWNRPEESAETFGARLVGTTACRGPFLRTGDLGFLDGGQLFIAGRIKDLVILRGRNHHPQDLELTAERSHPVLRPGGGAAFAVEAGGEERLVLVYEVERHGVAGQERVEEIAAAVRMAVAAEHEVVVFEVVLVPPGGIPRTTSGKVQRRACRELYLTDGLPVLGRSVLGPGPAEPAPLAAGALREALAVTPEVEREALLESWLRHTFARLARVDLETIDTGRPLGRYGLDSLIAVELKNAVEAELGAELSIAALLEGLTLSAAARQILSGAPEREAQEAPVPSASALHPLSWNQRSLWVQHRLAPESAAYHIAAAARVEGGADSDLLRQALQALVDRHAILRTTYIDGPDGPLQRIAAHQEMAFFSAEASGWTDEELGERLHEEAFRPFDLAGGPVFRAALFERRGEALLVLAVHHIAADLWSLAVLARELGISYGGDAERLPEAAGDYLDFVRWQEQRLAGPRGEGLWEHWRERLAGAPPLDLPTDRPRPPTQGFRGVTRTLRLPPADLAAVQAVARERDGTLFMTLLAGFQALLGRWSGQDDFLVGAPTTGRSSARWTDVAGYFVDLVALRAGLAGDPTGEELLAHTRREALDAFEHQDFPFALLAGRLQPERIPGRPPLVQAVLSLEKAPAPELAGLAAFALGEPGARLSLGALELESVALPSPGAQRDLTLLAAELDGGLALALQTDADLFDAATAERLLGHLAHLLGGLAAAPERRVAEIEILSAAERGQLLHEWSGTAPAYPQEEPVHALFEETARRAPQRVALACGDLELTYAELSERATRLARHLRSLGMAPEALVGIALERSPAMVISCLAVLQAGGAYVPLDTGYPRERLEMLLEEVPLDLVLTEEKLLDRLPPGGPPRLCLDRTAEEIARQATVPLDLPVSSRQLAYVMFTSGSTGRPKAVGVEHRSVVRLVRSADWADLGPEQVFLQLAPVSFDAATLEIWGPLLNGGRLALFPGGAPSLAELAEALERHRVTTLWLTAGLFHQVVEARIEALRGLSQLLAGGDVLSPAHVERAVAELPGCRLINGYGPTENTTFTCCHTIRGPVAGDTVPIGRPVANSRVYVVDRELRPMPVGVPGELCAGGDGLARGYLNRLDLTAERFVPDPFAAEPGDRLYRTGDRVRWRPGGTIEFLGRLDQQVKIRGFRVEPGEVEAALSRHPAVRQAAVLVSGGPMDRRLVAYVAAREESDDPGLDALLRSFLRARLPEPMVPSAFVVLPKLPLGPNGKVDRRALPDPEPAGVPAGSPAAARTPTEEILAGLWAELLGRESVGNDDGFFDLGGHSLLAARLLSRLREPFGVELPLKALFESPSLGAFAAAVDRARREAGGISAVPPPLRPVPRQGELPLSFAQERLWFLEQLTPGTAVYNIPAGLRLRGRLDEAALQRALDGIARRHEALRTVFGERGGLPVQTVLPPAGLPLARVDCAGLPDPAAAAREAALAEARRPFGIAGRPALVRATLLRLAPEDHLLVVVFHHIVADGASLDVFHRELEALYAGTSLPGPPVQPADHAVWEREALTGERIGAELSWWCGRLAGAPAALELPTDRPRPPVQSHRGAAEPWSLEPEPVRELRALARREGATLFITLLAGLATLLFRYARQEDVVIGAPVAHRSPETEGLIGLFVNTLPLRIALHGEPSFRGLLAHAREAVLGAHAHQMVPFERLVREVQPRRDLSRSPVFQVMLAVQDGVCPLPRLPGLEAEPVLLHSGAARFDLTLALDAREGGLAGGLELDVDLFDAAAAQRMLGHLRHLLAAAVADPGAPVLDLPLLGDAESAQILVEWSATAPPEAPGIGLQELFRAQAARTPEAVALIGRGERLTYRELDARADRLARRLQGIDPEALVGILSRRTPDMVAGMLGILAAGGAYLPLDPAYPAERLAFLLADSGARVVLAEAHGAAALPSSWEGTVILLEEPEDQPGKAPPLPCPPDQLAYVIYTSGSTGVPKGVGISHGSAAARVAWGAAAYGPERLRGVLAATSICFDLSVFEIFVPLAAGGTVVLAADALELADLPAAAEVTLVNTVPSALAALLRSDGLPASVRTINLAGEPLRRELVSRAYGQPGVEEVWNLYGPSEDTTYSTGVLVPRAGGEPSVGRPLPGDTVYVLDPRQRPIPAGVPGELWLGGAGLARGYLGRPHLTADRFRPDPFGGAPGGRLYRTGDLGRFQPDGAIELLGRLDHQVKVRGFRIEPGEIEAALARHPAVAEAVVAARGAGERAHLVAWVEVAGAAPQELRAWLGERLPAHLVPGVWVLLDRLPRTPNGKIDRAALPAPEAAAEGEREPLAPRTLAEELIAGIWADLLGAGWIGVHDDFFALGGHSLLAVQVVARLRETLGVELPLAALFEAPTVAGLADRLATPAEAPPPLVSVPRSGALPLSFAQERLWFLDRLSPGSAEYNVPAVFHLDGPLSASALRVALAGIAQRHEVLRTVFPETQDGPVQAVLPPGAVALPVSDLSALPEAMRSAEAARLAGAEARRPFDLARGPLLRALLVRLAPERHELVLDVHHIVYDGWSAGVLARELAALYAASHELPGLPVQYGDFAVWQRRWMEADKLHGQLAYWRGQLGAPSRPLELPTDRPRPAVRSPRGGLERFELGAELDAGVGAVARRAGATRFMALLAAFQVLLHRSTGQDEVRVGTPVANRGRREVEDLIGLFVNTLVLRADLGAAPGFAGLLRQVRETALGAFSHQDLPFEKLVEALAPERDLARNPLFQVLFLLAEPQPVRELAPGLTLRGEELHPGTAKVDLKLVLEPGGSLRGALEYSADLFDPGTVRRMACHLRVLLEGIVASPEARIDELPLLGPAERRQLVLAGPPAAAVAPGLTVPARFAAWARRTPDAPAVVFEEEQVSYCELARRARGLALHLRALGVGPEVRVALCLDRSAAMVAALLGVLEAGGAYVPLDPEAPAERLAFVLADSGAAALVTEDRLLGRLPAGALPVVSMDRRPSGAEEGAPGTAAGPEHLAYVIYTSGSTGRPKGVAVEHRQLASYLDGVLERLELLDGASYATVSTLAADLGNTMIFAALTTGGALHVVSRERVADAERMADLLGRHPVDCLKIVPSHLAALLAAPHPERLLPRRLLMLGGEASSWDLADRLRGLAPGCRLVNHYGPTETTIGVLTCEVAAEDGTRLSATVPTGQPLAGVRACVTGPLLEPVPPGTPGELLIGGATVSRGYLGRPDLTAERFVPAPFGEGGDRLYRTGDRVRLLPGGAVEFLGRIDQQVKIRGFRIEPGEIERLLESHPEVARAAVLAQPMAVSGDHRLAAWVAPRGAARTALAADLRHWLREHLPEVMIPAALQILDALPLTPNGKVDRRALADLPIGPTSGEAADRTAPRTETEELLAGVFAELLAAGSIGVEDDFFELGGHSLLATRLVSRARLLFGVDLELRAVFAARTVAGLAARIDEARRQGMPSGPVLTPRSRPAEESLCLSFAQERLWFFDQLEPGLPVYNVPRRLDLDGPLGAADRRALAAALSEIVRRHEGLRTVFVAAGGSPVQRIRPPAPFPLPLVDLAGLPEATGRDETERLAAEEARRPFDLARGPLLRALLLRRSAAAHHLLLTNHHIVSDGWSAGVMIRELAALHGAFRQGLPSPLPELPLQSADIALWQRQSLTGARLAAQLEYWRESLTPLPPPLELPFDRPRPAAPAWRGALVGSPLPAELAVSLARLGRRTGATLFMTLLGALQTLLWRYGRETDVAVGAPVSHRPPEAEGLIGFFVNTVILRTDLAGDPTFTGLLGRTREAALGAFAHQDVPFERVVEEVWPQRGGSASPLFQVLLVLQRDRPGELRLGELQARVHEVHTGTAKLDLTLALEEVDGYMAGGFEYDAALFDAATVRRMWGHLGHLLAAAAAEPERRIAELPLLSAVERAEALAAGTGPAPGLFPDGVLHALFEEQAALRPDAVAVEFEDARLTYAGLEARANQLARALRRRGAGPGTIVGFDVPRSLEMVIGLFGILKAGAAYVPLDSSFPRERVAAMIEDCRPVALLSLEGAIGPDVPLPVVRLDADRPLLERESPAPLSGGATADDLAFVMYTSGSTGRPKGVMVPHRGLLNRFLRSQEISRIGPHDALLHKAPLAFDFAIWEALGAMTAGGRTVLARPGGHVDFPYLARLLDERQVTLFHFVPSLLDAFLAQEETAGCGAAARQAFIGGEALTPALRDRFFERFPRVPLDNQYGPTEASIDVTWLRMLPDGPRPPVTPIGFPHPWCAAHVLAPSLEPQPERVPGELFLGGVCLARGYLGRPDLTAERFIPDPYGNGARLYRTGDLTRRLPGGAIEYLGRIDHQIKIRGVRIEPGEIEAALLAHPRLREAAVVLHESPGAAGKRLVACFVAEEPAPDARELRALLALTLPETMIPSAFVPLPALPRLASAKIDRRALARIEPPAGSEEAGPLLPAAPRAPAEELIAGIWTELLGIEPAQADDDFFALGGHSLLAAQLAARLRELFGVELPLRAIFEAPTVAGIAVRIEAVRTARSAEPVPPLRPRSRNEPAPLSFSQERLWFLDQLDAGSSPYTIPSHVRLSGLLDAEVLARTFAELVRRHEALRTTFGQRGGVPFQEIAPAGGAPMPRVDLAGLPAPVREREMLRLAAEEARRPFDLARGPLLRNLLVRLGPEDHVLAATMHHIVSDGWSATVLIREMTALYEAFSAGLPSPLPEPVLHYADYAVWERERLRGERLATELAWWSERLAGLEPLELPTDRPRPAVQSYRGARRRLVLSPATAAGLRALGRREGASLFMVLLALWDVLLARSSGRADLAVGTPVANRTRGEVQGLVGFFVNTLVLRTDLARRPRFRDLLGQLRATALDAWSHGELPFGKLVEHLQPERLRDRNPLVQVLCTLQNQPWPEMRIGDVRMAPLELETDVARFDLALTWSEGERGLEGTLEHSTDLFDGATAQRLLRHSLALVRAVLDDPELPIDELPLLSAAERAEALAAGTGPKTRPVPDGVLHALFEEQVPLRPDAVAVEFEGACLTYAGLEARANQLARALRPLGAGPGTVVGVHLPRSLEMVVGLLGVLKAGAAYLPLDASFPRERLAAMIEDGRPAALLTLAAAGDGLPAGSFAVPVLRLDADRAALERESPASLSGGATADDLACVLYTSGSTGRPKGVMVPHRGLWNRFLVSRELRLDPQDVVLQKAPLAFDFALWEALGAMAAGGRTVLARPDRHVDFPYLARLLDESQVTVVHFVPSLLEAFLAQEETTGCGTALRQAYAGGEALTPALRDRFFARFPQVPLDNQYGPTEASIDVIWQRLPPDGPRPPVVPIGRPLAHCAAHVLEPSLEPLPPGAPGELFLGGVCLARGYLGRPDLTAERFIPDPFGEGGRLYRTGDLARRLSDGAIEYRGRIDQQIKIRGVRIEPGEIEAALLAHPRLREAAVVVHQGSPDRPGRRLVACFAAEEPAPDARELRALLARTLPETMLPAAFVPLPALPRLASAKVDRGALARIELPDVAQPAGPAAPRTPVEELIAGIWSELLGVETVRADDDFFALGGHSLLAVQVVSRLRDWLGAEIAVRDLFDEPILAGLARRVELALRAEPATAAPLSRIPRNGLLQLSFAQQRLWFLDQLAPGSPTYNLPAAVELAGRLDAAALAAAFAEVVRRHEALRTTFQATADGPVQVIAEPDGFVLPRVDLRSLPGPQRAGEESRLAAAEARRGFDLAGGPLLRATLLHTAAERHMLLLTMHHIVSDGWSVDVLVREIGVLYAAFLAGQPSPLPELAVQYPDFAAWQRRALSGETLEAELAWWRRELAGMPPALDLPTDHPRPALPSGRGAVYRFVIDPECCAGLTELSRRHGATLFMTLLAGFAALLGRITGQDDLAVGTPVAGRTRVETEPLIGFFVNTLALRAVLAGDPDLTELLARVRTRLLAAWVHQEVPFERVVEELAPERGASRPPLVQAVLVLQNAPAGPNLSSGQLLPGLALTVSRIGTETAKFDLTCTLTETESGLAGTLEYSRDLLERPSIERLAGHFMRLLAAAVADPRRRLSELPLLMPQEQAQILVEWSGAATAYPRESTIHALFAGQAALRPDAVAVEGAGTALTYGELRRRAGRQARRLRDLGVGPEVRVGVCLDRSPARVVATLAVLEAGGAYVPLDPSHPPERLASALHASAAAVLVTEERWLAVLPPVAAAVLCLDREEAGEEPPTSPVDVPEVPASALAYVMYTSGSTGEPKGVAVPHRAVIRLVRATGYARFGPDEVFLQLAPYAFDASTLELWGALLNGGRVAIPPPGVLAPAELGELLADHGVTTLWLTAGLFHQMVEDNLAGLAGVRQLLAGGDVLAPAHVRRVVEELPGTRLINGYGPTENTTFTCCHPVAAEDLGSSVPLGRPISNTRVYVLDRNLAPVPVGVAGELCAGGDGLARGYLDRPAWTAERFVPDPFGGFRGEAGDRLYRTGDLSRYLPDGRIEFLGRIDTQVKIRGFRIEPEEIETEIARHAGVREAAVVARPGRDGQRLVAYFVPASGWEGGSLRDELRTQLRQRLPEPMIPSAFLEMPYLPLTTNGKLDRAALPEPDPESTLDDYVAPRTPVEELIAGIWAKVLGLERVGVCSDFFALGGHSLLATRVVTRVRQTLGVDLGVRELFEARTVEGMTLAVAAELLGGADAEAVVEAFAAAGAAPVEEAVG